MCQGDIVCCRYVTLSSMLTQISLDMPWKKAKKLIREDPRYKNFTESDHVRLHLAARKPNLYDSQLANHAHKNCITVCPRCVIYVLYRDGRQSMISISEIRCWQPRTSFAVS